LVRNSFLFLDLLKNIHHLKQMNEQVKELKIDVTHYFPTRQSSVPGTSRETKKPQIT